MSTACPGRRAWAYLLLLAVLNFAVGSLNSFSFWRDGFFRYFPLCGPQSIHELLIDTNTAALVVTTTTRHGFQTGDAVVITGVVSNGTLNSFAVNATDLNAAFLIDVVDFKSFTRTRSQHKGTHSLHRHAHTRRLA